MWGRGTPVIQLLLIIITTSLSHTHAKGDRRAPLHVQLAGHEHHPDYIRATNLLRTVSELYPEEVELGLREFATDAAYKLWLRRSHWGRRWKDQKHLSRKRMAPPVVVTLEDRALIGGVEEVVEFLETRLMSASSRSSKQVSSRWLGEPSKGPVVMVLDEEDALSDTTTVVSHGHHERVLG